MKCKSCGMELKDDESLYCNHPACIVKRAEELLNARDDV